MDLRPDLVRLGNNVAQEFAKTKQDYSTLVAKTAAAASLDDNEISMFIGIANKQRVEMTGDRTQLPATPEAVADILHSNPTRVKVAYKHPEFSRSQDCSGMAKCASNSISEDDSIEITSIIREKARLSEHSYKTKIAKLRDSMEESYGKIQSNLSILKTLGVKDTDLRSKFASLSLAESRLIFAISDTVKKSKNAFINPANYNVEGYINGVIQEAVKLTKEASEFKDLESKLKLASDNKVKLYTQGERFYA